MRLVQHIMLHQVQHILLPLVQHIMLHQAQHIMLPLVQHNMDSPGCTVATRTIHVATVQAESTF